MGFLKRLTGSGEPAPPWAAPLDGGGYRRFIEAMESVLQARGKPFRIAEGWVEVDEGGGEPQKYGLANLVQLCAATQPDRWQSAIATHFANLDAAARENAELEEAAGDFERVRTMVKVRLYPPEHVGAAPDGPVHRDVAPGLVAVLVYDRPTTVSSIPRTHVEGWSQTTDELLEIGLANVRAQDAVQRQSVPLEGGGTLEALTGDHFFAASHALLLAEHVGADAPDGVLVSVPHRHAVLFHPIRDATVVTAVNTMIVVAGNMYQQGPGSLSPGLYWWRAGAFSVLPTNFDGRNVQFAPPDEFVAVLNRVVG